MCRRRTGVGTSFDATLTALNLVGVVKLRTVELFVNVVFRWNAFHAEQGLAGVSVMGFIEAPLIVEERRAVQ